jgi:hypothetical protein
MPKNKNEIKSPAKRFFGIILKIFLILFGALILFIVGVFATAPLFDKIDHDKFITLDSQMQGLYQKLKAASGGVDDWKYETICTAELAGDFPTGQYFCSATVSLDKIATSVDAVNALQDKYYPLINDYDALTSQTNLDLELPNDFGKKFVVSSAEERYRMKSTDIKCDYLLKLGQSIEDINLTTDSYGSAISNSVGDLDFSLGCTGKARGHWYAVDAFTSTFID